MRSLVIIWLIFVWSTSTYRPINFWAFSREIV